QNERSPVWLYISGPVIIFIIVPAGITHGSLLLESGSISSTCPPPAGRENPFGFLHFWATATNYIVCIDRLPRRQGGPWEGPPCCGFPRKTENRFRDRWPGTARSGKLQGDTVPCFRTGSGGEKPWTNMRAGWRRWFPCRGCWAISTSPGG